jgi:hypothetical protein
MAVAVSCFLLFKYHGVAGRDHIFIQAQSISVLMSLLHRAADKHHGQKHENQCLDDRGKNH